jgi:hypothetical protein
MSRRSDDDNAADPGVPDGAAVFPQIPAELGVQPLFLALLHAIVFLDGSSDEIVNAQAAQEALEYMTTYFQRLRGPDLARVREDLDCLLTFARQQGWDKQGSRFLKDFLKNFGIEPS